MAAARSPLQVLVGDQTSEAIYLLTDRNRDGDTADSGESKAFFDANNKSGLLDPLASVLDMHQAKDRSVYAGDNATDSVYRLFDRNRDGDANDSGEAKVWFSAAGNAAGYTLATPNGIGEDARGSIYVVLAGTGSQPADRIYKTTDKNGDGDAQDVGEASIWVDLQTLNPTSSAFEISFAGNAAYVTDTVGGAPDVIYRMVDKDRSGDIQASEVTRFIDDSNGFGVNVDFAHDSQGKFVYAWEFIGDDGPSRLFRMVDSDGSGSIDQANETQTVWDASYLPAGYAVFAGPGMDVAADGSILLAANGVDANEDSVIRLVDVNQDGDFTDAGETNVLLSRADGALFLDRPRPVQDYATPTSGSDILVKSGTARDDLFRGTASADSYRGLAGDDNVLGRAGDDNLFGNDGDDFLVGDAGADDLYGGIGDDNLLGGAGNDLLEGAEGNDTLATGKGVDLVYGGTGDDLLITDAHDKTGAYDIFDGGDGFDTLGIEVGRAIPNRALFRSELASFNELAEGGASVDFEFTSLRLSVTNIEAVEILIA